MTEAAQAQPWYARWFDHAAYAVVYARRDAAEARRTVELVERVAALDPGARVVDVACGGGRHSVELARRGYRVTGVDLSERRLDEARAAARQAGVQATFARGDMREPACDACADAVVNLFTAFGFFDASGNARAVEAMGQALRPGGVLVQDFLNAEHVCATLVPRSERVAEGLHVEETRWIEAGRVRKRIVLRPQEHPDAAPRVFDESVALIGRDALERMHRAAGLLPQQALGDYDGRPHAADTPRLILVSRRG